jgi:segregation and condensation protein A
MGETEFQMTDVNPSAISEEAIAMTEFEEDPPRADLDEPAAAYADDLLINIDGYEGPIDILLTMARDQKVDLVRISILQLARQYLAFIDRASQLKLDLAAEYLVMAAWLAYLKSRLLLPRDGDSTEPSAQEMADALQFQLRRLEAMQNMTNLLFQRPRLGINVFPRGMAEGLKVSMKATYDATLYELLDAYGSIETRKKGAHYELPTFTLMSMEAATERMTKMLGKLPRKGPWSVWTTLSSFVPESAKDRLYTRSSVASLLTVGLEMAKQGRVEIRQDGTFRPIYLRALMDETRQQELAEQGQIRQEMDEEEAASAGLPDIDVPPASADQDNFADEELEEELDGLEGDFDDEEDEDPGGEDEEDFDEADEEDDETPEEDQ